MKPDIEHLNVASFTMQISSNTLPTNCVESLYQMAATMHRISNNLKMYHCVDKLLFDVVN